MAEHICDICIHEQACAAWVRHCTALYEDFRYSADNCPYFAPVVKGEWGWEDGYAVCPFCDSHEWLECSDNFCPNCGADMRRSL